MYGNLEDTRKGLLAFVAQLKAGKGLTLVAECMEGQFAQMADTEMEKIREVLSFVFELMLYSLYFKELYEAVKASRIRGFCDVLVTEHYTQGVSHLIQTSGLGGLRHNRFFLTFLNDFLSYFSVVCAWPEQWSTSNQVN